MLTTHRAAWVYDPPTVLSAAPAVLPPAPATPVTLVVTGTSFGGDAGVATLGNATLVCPHWSHSMLNCTAPPGVVASAPLVVRASSGLSSGQASGAVSFRAPAITSVALAAGAAGNSTDAGTDAGDGAGSVVAPTAGGTRLVVRGADFAVLPGGSEVPASVAALVWLVQAGVVPGHSWAPVQLGPDGWPLVLRCSVLPPSLAAPDPPPAPDALTCEVPPGSGRGWRVLVVNHEVDSGALDQWAWRATAPAPGFLLHYAAPAVHAVVSAAPAPATGGFHVTLLGAGLSPWPPRVRVGGLSCPVLPGAHSDAVVVCVAPPLQLDAGAAVRVEVQGQVAVGRPVVYDPPSVTALTPPVLEAVAPPGGTARTVLTIAGKGFGARYRAGVGGDHVVTVG